MSKTKKLIALLLVLAMLLSVVPFAAFATDVSFTKVTSAGDITTDNIGTCTAEDAKAWALANWDVAHNDYYDTHLAFYSNTGELNVVLVDYGMNEHSFSKNFDYCINTSYSIVHLKTWYADGEAICICTAAAPAPEEPPEGAAEDGPLVGTVIKIGDTLTLDGDYFEYAPGLKTSTTADLELYQISYNEDFNAWLFAFTPNGVFLVEGDETPKPDGFYVSGGNGTESHPYTFALHYGPAPAEPNNGASITVAETISENFYLDDDFYGETAYVSFTYNHNSDTSETADISTDVKAMSSLDDATDGRKVFSVTQAPAQATEPITINVYANADDAQAGTNAIDTIDYSVYTYCRDIIENYDGEKADEMKALAKSTLDYAAAAQTYFGYNTDNMATKDATGDFYNDVANADLSNVAGVSAAPSCIKSVSLVVKSDLEINLLSTEPISVTNASIDATKGTERFAVSTKQNGDYYVVHIAGIEPANMGKEITINTDRGNIVMTANSVVKMFANSNNANLSTLAKALFEYGNAANAYFG